MFRLQMPYFSLHNVEKTQAKSLGFFLHLWKNIMFYMEIFVKKQGKSTFLIKMSM